MVGTLLVAMSLSLASRVSAREAADHAAERKEIEAQLLAATLRIGFTLEVHVEGAPAPLIVRDIGPSALATLVGPRTVVTHGHFDADLRRLYGDALRHVWLREVTLYHRDGRLIGRYRVGYDFLAVRDAAQTWMRFAVPITAVAPIPPRPAPARALARHDEVAVAVVRDGTVVVIRARVIVVDHTTVTFAYGLQPGDSGGGVLFEGRFVANNWYRVEGRLRQCTPRGCQVLEESLEAGVAALDS